MFKITKKQIQNVLIVTIVGLIVLLFTLSFKLKTENQVKGQINLETEKYKYIPKETDEDIISFLSERSQKTNIPTKAMNNMFQSVFERMNDENKFYMFSLYYNNYNNYINKYNKLLDNYVYQDYLYDLNYTEDINDFNTINKIKDITLKTILLELRLNNFKIIMNKNYPQIYFDYEPFFDRFEGILPLDYINFCKLEFEGSKSILNPGNVEVNTDGIIWYLNSYKDFIEKTENEELKNSAITIFQKALGLYLGTGGMGQFYLDRDSYEVSPTFIESYEEYIEEYSDFDLSNLIRDTLTLINEKSGKGDDFLFDIDTLIYNYLDEKGWIIEDFH